MFVSKPKGCQKHREGRARGFSNAARMKKDNVLLDLGAMASRLRVQPQDLRAEAEANTLPHVRVGKRGLLFNPEQVMAALDVRAAHRVSGPAKEVRHVTP